MKERKDIFSKITYAFGDIYGGGAFIIVGLLLLVFLTKVEGISGTWAGIIIFIGKAWDAVTDPFMGMLSDRTKSKYGRRRPYFLLGSIPVLASWVMLWYSFGISGEAAKIIYYTVAFMFFSTAFTIVMVPYNAILADMTSDYNKRSAFTGVRLSFSAGAAIVCGIVPGIITGSFLSQKQGYLVMAVIFGIVFGLCWLIVFLGTWENTKNKEKTVFSYRDWFSVLKNKSFRYYATIFVFSQMAIDITMAIAVFYLGVSLQKDYLFVPSMAAILVVQLIFIIVFSIVAQKYSKKIPGVISASVWIAANVMIFSFSQQTPDVLVVAICALIGVGAAGCNMVSWSILPDISDVDELMTGKRREGLYSGVSTFLRKLSGGFAVGSIGFMLDIIRYSDKAVTSGNIEPITFYGIKIMFCLIPVLFLAVMLLNLRKYKLGKKEFAILHEVLVANRRDGVSVELDANQIAVCEQITGMKEKGFFGRE
ncbi:MAG: MFS transporter [Saccharofermentanales bacterium]